MKKLQTNRLMSVLICGLALLLSSCTDQQDSPVPPANEDQQEELLQVADDFESRADFLAAAYKKTKPQTTKVWDATVDPDDFVLLFVREDQKTYRRQRQAGDTRKRLAHRLYGTTRRTGTRFVPACQIQGS